MRTAIAASLALVLSASGCILTSSQITVSLDLASPMDVPNASLFFREAVDLNAIAAYVEHKDKLHEVADVALLGELRNNGLTFVKAEFYATADSTEFASAAQVRANATRLWGPLEIAPQATLRLDWNKSAGLVNPRGRELLVAEAKGDGRFTLYVVAQISQVQTNFSYLNGVLVLVLDAGT